MMYSHVPLYPSCPQGEPLPVDRISPRGSLRQGQENLSLAALAESIRCYGLMRPVVVRRTGAGRYVIISGNRRLMACRMLGLDCIAAWVLREDAAWQTSERLLNALLTRRMHYLQEADVLQALHSSHQMAWEELGRILTADVRGLVSQARLTSLTDDVKALLLEEGAPMSIALQLLRLPDGRRQLAVMERIAAQRLCIRDSALLISAELRRISRKWGTMQEDDACDEENEVEKGKKENPGTRRVVRIIRDERLFINAVRDIAGQMQEAGFQAILAERWVGGQLEMVLRVPLRRRRMARYQSS